MEKAFTNLHDLIRGFAGAMDLFEPDVQNHHQKVAYLSYRIAEAMGLPESERLLALYAALLHDIGSVMTDKDVSLRDVERNASAIARMGGEMLKMFTQTLPVAEIVRNSQSSWKRLSRLPKLIRGGQTISQIVHLSDVVSLLLGEENSVLNQVSYVHDCIQAAGGEEFSPDVLAAFDSVCRTDAVWMDLLYRPELFLELIPADETLTLRETGKLTELASLIIDFRSPFTAMHSAGVAASAERMASLMGMSEDECLMMRIAGHLHDLGKLKISRAILEKPGKLTDKEFNVIKEHAYYTYVLLKDIRGFEQIAPWAAFHHEKLNGEGYPFRLRGEDIPLGARIMAAADIFSAITEKRPYRDGMVREPAMAVMRDNVERGTLSGQIVSLLLEHYDEIDAARSKASEAAGKRYFDSMAKKEPAT